ncbi:hypothetical protein NEOLEDRAFT_1141294 [Neolentinus lepideus HHB14362 ss-1]|uniref:BBC1/AIM3 cysteine proteinase-fold domain-containing protein n=1 Tax=Neolentinus lepideus HHB14362 ss-1 TaxID=1314782 RepID=A0A165NR18_9AGAM|nr:hypothetical protein NEOLEDRAFT_1141294 [Neolentinus lepideus HHB14362 ss-1]
MSDEAPPPKAKPGSLRDRIAAFEKQNATAPAPGPPPPRPKPGHVQWKPKQASPPTSPAKSSTDLDTASSAVERARAGMSAADAKESIGKGGSLKERMAALQGRGAFGAPAGPTSPPIPPKPAGEKPKWKPPPAPVALPEEEGADVPERVRSPPAQGDAEPSETEPQEAQAATEGEAAQAEPDPEEEERRRRAEIAARMARLGGARIGMAPPVPAYGKKPPVKKEAPPPEAVETDKAPEVAKVDEVKPLDESGPEVPVASSPAVDIPASESSLSKSSEEGYFKTRDSASPPLLSPESASITSTAAAGRSPSSMPVPTGPKRAAPPRRKAAKSPSPAAQQILDEPIKECPSDTPVLETPAPEVEAKSEVPAELQKAVEEIPVEASVPEPGAVSTHEDYAPNEDLSALGALHADAEIEDLPKQVEEAEEAAAEKHIEDLHVKQSSADTEVPVADEPVETHAEPEAEAAVPEQEEQQEAEEDEDVRRKRVAERLAKMGGINPLAAPPPLSPSADRQEPVRKQSLGVTTPSSPALEQRDSTKSNVAHTSSPVERRTSVDSIGIGRPLSASAGSRKSSMDIATSPPPVPTFTKPQPGQRKSSVGSVSADVDESPPPVPTSARPEVPERRTSVGSVRSIGEPRRRQSEDDWARREVSVSSQPPLPEEEQEDNEYNEMEEREQRADEQVSHVVEADDDLRRPEIPSEVEDEVEYQELAKRTDAPETLYELHDEPSDDAEPLSATTPIPIPPPLAARPPPTPNMSTRPVMPHEESTAEVPTESHVSQSKSVTKSMPPPQAPPAPPPELEPESPEHVVSPLPRRSVLHVPPPLFEPEEELPDEDDGVPDVVREDEGNAPHHSESAGRDERTPVPSIPVRYVSPPNDVREGAPPVPSAVTHEIYDEELPTPVAPPLIPKSTRPVSDVLQPTERPVPPPLVLAVRSDEEVMDESDGDPIDPQFHSPQRSPGLPPITMPGARPSSTPPAASSSSSPDGTPGDLPEEPTSAQSAEQKEDPEQARRHTIAERMAKLGGIRFGAPPPVRPQPPPARPREDEPPIETSEEAQTEPLEAPEVEGNVEEEEEDEQTRRQRIAARLANMGGMRFGMMPGAVPPPARPPPPHEDNKSPPPPRRTAPLARPPPPPKPKEVEPESETDDGVHVEAEESELEEVTYEDAEEEAPPPVPSRANRPTSGLPHPPSAGPTPAIGSRPPVPAIPHRVTGRRSTADSSHSLREPSATAHQAPMLPPQQSEYVMVDSEAEPEDDVPPPLPPSRPTRPPPSRTAPSAPTAPPPPPADSEPSDSMTSSQWELPTIPSGTLDFGATSDLSASGFSEDSTTYPTSPSPPPPPPAIKAETSEPATSSAPAVSKFVGDVNISPDELMTIWGKVGIQVCEVATTFFEKSKKSLVGDGTYAGFVDAVLSEVPNASEPSPPIYGYLVYSQTGSTVQKRVSDIMPGDILTAQDAKLKGHKGLQTYHQNVGTEELLIGVVTEFEAKKSKVRVFQANQHVGQQTVESVSYRLDDLKSGTIKVYRVLEAS